MTQEKSTQIENLEAQPPVGIPTTDWKGALRIMRFEFAQGATQGAAGSLAELVKLPAGNIRVLLHLSRINHADMGASRTMDLGWLAYTEPDGTAVPADPNGLDDSVSVAAVGSFVPGGTLGGDETKLFQSKSGVTLTAQINDGTLQAAKTIGGTIVYVQD